MSPAATITLLNAEGISFAEKLAALEADLRDDVLGRFTDEELRALEYDWTFWRREKQAIPQEDFEAWLILAGRGFGKTRTGAETIRQWAEAQPGCRIAIVGRTAGDVRDVMVEGPSGILAISPPWFMPKYEPTKRRLTWPNGSVATTFSADEPEALRGPEFDKAWCDELAAWRRNIRKRSGEEPLTNRDERAWDNLQFGLRLGSAPQVVITTTPKPTKLLKEIIGDPGTVITRGSSYENAGNLAPRFFRRVIRKYEGTRIGLQEIHAEVLDDVPGALWRYSFFDYRQHPELKRIVVAVDPSASADPETSAEAGIIVAGRGIDDRGYVLDDRSGVMRPLEWGRRALRAYWDNDADMIVAEVNNGGDMVETVIQASLKPGEKMPPFKKVHASRGKRTRAEPIAIMYEKGDWSHVQPFPQLEEQCTQWTPEEDSPDRMDALVWAGTELFLEGEEPLKLTEQQKRMLRGASMSR